MIDNLEEEFNKIVDMSSKRSEQILAIMTKMLSEDFSILGMKSNILSYTQMLLTALTTSTFFSVWERLEINEFQRKSFMNVYISNLLGEISDSATEIKNIKEMH